MAKKKLGKWRNPIVVGSLVPRVKPIKIRGWDWTELLPVFGLAMPEGAEESRYAYLVRERLYKAAAIVDGLEDGDRLKAVEQIGLCRQFVRRVAANSRSYDQKVWAAIGQIEDPWTFVQWLGKFLESAWT